jgi:hypothetical protein
MRPKNHFWHFVFLETQHFIDHSTSVHRVFRITSGAEFEMKLRLDKLQVLAIMCAASFEERETCRKLAEDKPAAEHLISNTIEPT